MRTVELNLEFATLRAARDGFMSNSQVKPGALITAQQTLLTTLYSSDPMWVYFSISEERLLGYQAALTQAGVAPDSSLITPRKIPSCWAFNTSEQIRSSKPTSSFLDIQFLF